MTTPWQGLMQKRVLLHDGVNRSMPVASVRCSLFGMLNHCNSVFCLTDGTLLMVL